MNTALDISKLLHGYVRVWNEAGQVVEGRNLVVYTGGDIIAELLAGNAQYKISHLYFAYQNGGIPPVTAVSRMDTVAYFTGLSAPRDYLRVPILQPVTITASDVNHNGNMAQFLAIGNAASGVHGVAFGAGSGSQVWTVGLAAAPTGVYTGDVLYARYLLAAPLPAAGSGQVSAAWITEAQ